MCLLPIIKGLGPLISGFPLSMEVSPGSQRTGTNADTLAMNISASSKVFVSDLGVLHLSPMSMKLWQANTFASKYSRISDPYQFLTTDFYKNSVKQMSIKSLEACLPCKA